MKKTTLLLRASAPILSCSIAALLAAPVARAATLYWDENSTTAGAGATPTGTWGVDNAWNTDPLGTGTGTFQITTASTDNLQFVAGPAATSGNNAYVITVSGSQAANSITVLSPGNATFSSGTIFLGAGGLSVSRYAYGTTNNSNQVQFNSTLDLTADQTWTNSYQSNNESMVIAGNLTGSGNLTKLAFNDGANPAASRLTFSAGSSAGWTGALTINGGALFCATSQQLVTRLNSSTLTLNGVGNGCGQSSLATNLDIGSATNFTNNINFISGAYGYGFSQGLGGGFVGSAEVFSGVLSGTTNGASIQFSGGNSLDLSGVGLQGQYRLSGSNTGLVSTRALDAFYIRTGYVYLDSANAAGTNNSLSWTVGQQNGTGENGAGLFASNGITVAGNIATGNNGRAGGQTSEAYVGLDGTGSAIFSGTVTLQNASSTNNINDLHLRALAGGTVTFSGNMVDTGTNGLPKFVPIFVDGGGTVVLTGTNSTFYGNTNVNAGTLKLDFSASTTGTNILNKTANRSTLAMGGGTLNLVGKASTANSQQFNGAIINTGASAIALSANATANPLWLTLGALTRNTASTVDFTLPTGTQSGSNGIATTSTTLVSNSVLVSAASNGVAFGTVAGADWASLNGGNIVALPSYNANSFTTTDNTDVTGAQVPSANVTVNTLRFNDPGASSVTLSGANIVSTGGILATANTAINGAAITGGTLQAGGGNELVLINNGNLSIGSAIVDGAAAGALTISGSGVTTLGGANTYTGVTTVNSGTLSVSNIVVTGGSSNLGNATSALILGDGGHKGALSYTGTSATYTRGFTLGPGGGEIDVTTAGQTLIVGAIANAGGLVGYQTTTGAFGNLTIGGAGNVTFANAGLGQGWGGLVMNGGGLLTLSSTAYALAGSAVTGTNVYYLTAAGGVQVGQPITGSGIPSNTTVTAVSGTVLTISANTTGAVTNANFTTANTYTGPTTINSGTLKLGVSSAIPSYSPITINNGTLDLGGFSTPNLAASVTLNGGTLSNGTLNLNNGALFATSGTVSAALTGGGSSLQGILIKTSAGTLTLTGNNSYTGATTVSGGTLQIGAGGVAGAIGSTSGIALSASTTLAFSRTDNYGGNFSRAISGSGNVVLNSGTLIVTSSNTYIGATTVSSGTLQIGAAGTVGSIASTSGISLSSTTSTVAFNRTDNFGGSFSTAISGSGNLALTTGTLIITGSNSYTGATTISGSGTLQIGDGITDGSIASSGGIVNSGALIYNLLGSQTYANTISGTGALTKSGPGTLTLTGSNSYTGATTIGSGTLQIGNGASGSLASSTVSVNTGGALALNLANSGTLGSYIVTALGTTINVLGSGTSTFANNITGPGGLTLSGSGLTILGASAVDSYAGPTNINAGVLQLNGTNDAYLSTVNVNTGNGLAFGGTAAAVGGLSGTGSFALVNTSGSAVNLSVVNSISNSSFAGTITGTNPGSILTKSGSNTFTLTGSSTFLGTTVVSSGTLNVTVDAALGAVASGVTIANGATLQTGTTFDFNASRGVALSSGTGFFDTQGNLNTIAGAITGSGALGKIGSGTLILSASNTLTGGVKLNAGTLAINNAAALGTIAGTFVVNGGAIDNTSGAALTTLNYPQTWNSDFAFTGAADGTHNLNLGAGAVSLGTTSGTTRTITVNAGNLTIGGVIGNGTTANTLVKSGSGALTLTAFNNFAGGVVLNAGTLNMNTVQALGLVSGTFVINGGALDNTSGAPVVSYLNYPQTWNSDFTFLGAADGTHDINMGTGAVSLGAASGTTRTVTVNAGTLTVNGVISAGTTANSVIKSGSGTLRLAGANTFTGGVILNAGGLYIPNAASLGTTAGAFTINGGFIFGGNQTLNAYAQTWNGDFGFGFAGMLLDNSLNLGTGAVSLGTGGGTSRTITANGLWGTLTVGGVISNGATANSLIKAGPGILALTASNAFTGGITLNAGTLIPGNAGALGSGTLTINGGSLNNNGASMTLTTNNPQVWNGDFTYLGGGNGYNLALGGGAIALGGNRTVTCVANTLTEGGNIADSGSNYGVTWVSGVANTTSGNITLTGSSTYGGPTVVQSQNGAGSVYLNTGFFANTSGVTVNGGAKFQVGATGVNAATNRINPATTLILGGAGGGTFQLLGSQTTTLNKQSFASLTVGTGADVLYTDQSSNASQITFTGANPYTRSVGGVVRYVGLTGTFTNAPSGAGNVIGSGTNAMLIGATYNNGTTSTDANYFVKAATGAITAASNSADTYGSGVNTSIGSSSFGIPSTGVTQSLFVNAGLTLTLPGAFTIESGGLLATNNPFFPVTITGGSLKAGIAGGDLWIVQGGAVYDSFHGMVINSQIIDNAGSSLTKVGPRTLYLTNTNNTYAGGTYLGEGTLNVASEGSLGSGALNFTGAATLQAAGNVALGSRAVPVAPGVTATFDTNGYNITANGVISGANSGLTKVGTGMLTLSGSNSYTGPTTVTNGTLKLDFSAPGAPVSNIINPSSVFAPGAYAYYQNVANGASSDTVAIQGAANTANTQTFSGVSPLFSVASTTVGEGMNHLNLAAGSGGTLTVNLGGIVKGGNGGGNIVVNTALDITMGAGVTVTTSNFLNQGIINPQVNTVGNGGAWITVNGSSWATLSGSNIVPLPNASYTTINSGGNMDVLTSGSFNNAGTIGYTLRFNDTNNTGTDKTVTLASNASSQISGGPILVTSNVGAHTSTVTGGYLIGYSRRALDVFQNNTAGDLVINSTLVDANGNQSIDKYGAGRLVLTATNSNTFGTYVNEGTLLATGDYTPSVTKANSIVTSGTNILTVPDTTGLFLGQAVTGSGIASSMATVITAISGTTVTLSANSTVSGTAAIYFQSGAALGGFSPTGGSYSNYIGTSGTLQLGNGGAHGSLDPNAGVNNLGALILDRNDVYTFGNALAGALATNSLSGTPQTNTFQITGGGTCTLGYSGALNGTAASGTNMVTLANAGNVFAGMAVSGSGIAVGTTVSYVDGTTVKLSANTTAPITSATFTTTNTYSGITQIFGGSTLILGSATALGSSTLDYTNSYGGTFSFGNFTAVTLGGLKGDQDLPLLSAYGSAVALTVGGNQFDTTYSGSLSGTGSSLIKTGIGTLTLTGSNSYSGGTAVNLGTLNGNALSLQGNIADALGAAVAFNQTTSGTYAGAIGGAGNLTKTGAGTLTLTGSNTYTGLTDVQAGTLATGASYRIASTSALRISGGTLDISSYIEGGGAVTMTSGTIAGTTGQLNGISYNFINSGVVTAALGGNSTIVKSGTGTVVLAGNNTQNGAITINGGTLQLGNGGTTGSLQSSSAITDSATLAFDRSDTLTQGANFAATISGSGGIVQMGTGRTILSGSNSYSGGSTVSSGTLQLANAHALGAGGLTVNGGALDLHGNSVSVPAFSGAAGTVTNTLSGTATVTANISGAFSYAGSIADGAGIVALNKSGAGTLTLSGSNSYSGGTTVSSGSLQIGNANALGTGGVTVNGGALDLHGNSVSVSALSGAGGKVTNTVAGTVTFTANTSGTSSYAGSIAGGAGVVALSKSGAGTLTLSGSNSYSGGTTVSDGTLQIGNANALGTGGLTISGGALDLNGNNVSVPAFSGAGGTVTNTVAGTATFTANISGASSYAGSIADGAGVVALTKSGAGTLALTGNNSHSGGTTLSSGSLQIGNANALGTGGLTVNGGTLDLYGNSVSVTGFSGAGGTVTNTVPGSSTLITSVSGSSAYTGNITDGAGSVIVDKQNTGELILSGSIQMTGLTAEAGSVQLTQSGSIGTVALYSGATVSMAAHSGSTYNVLNVSSLSMSGFTVSPSTVPKASAFNVDSLGSPAGAGMLTAAGQSQNSGAAANTQSAAEPASPEAVPEPGTLGMLLTGAFALLGFRRKAKSGVR